MRLGALAGLIVWLAHGTATAATATVVFNFNDFNLSCFSYSYCSGDPANCSSDFTMAFVDPTPAGAVVTRVRLVSESFVCGGAPVEQATFNGTVIGTATPNTTCNCTNNPVCGQHTISSGQFASGLPGYVYGTVNVMEISVLGGVVDDVLCTDRVTIEIEYSLCGNRLPELGEFCDDGDADYCDGCTPLCTASPVCDDGDLCTDDTCDALSGACTYAFNSAGCNDGNACTINDQCTNGFCLGTNLNCNDGDLCTDDSCNPVNGSCVNSPITCDDSNVCTSDLCNAGTCSNTPIGGCCLTDPECDDLDPCTTDQCIGNVCVSSGSCPPDAGFPDSGFPDSGVVVDGGFPDAGFPDAGFRDAGDAGFADLGGGVTDDASVADTSPPADAAPPGDAAAPADAGFADTGVESDAGFPVDATPPADAAPPVDSGAEVDAGDDGADRAIMGPERDEAGTRLNDGSGCGCTVSRAEPAPFGSVLWCLPLVLLWLARRRSSVA